MDGPGVKDATSPGVKATKEQLDADQPLESCKLTPYRAVVARANYLASAFGAGGVEMDVKSNGICVEGDEKDKTLCVGPQETDRQLSLADGGPHRHLQ